MLNSSPQPTRPHDGRREALRRTASLPRSMTKRTMACDGAQKHPKRSSDAPKLPIRAISPVRCARAPPHIQRARSCRNMNWQEFSFSELSYDDDPEIQQQDGNDDAGRLKGERVVEPNKTTRALPPKSRSFGSRSSDRGRTNARTPPQPDTRRTSATIPLRRVTRHNSPLRRVQTFQSSSASRPGSEFGINSKPGSETSSKDQSTGMLLVDFPPRPSLPAKPGSDARTNVQSSGVLLVDFPQRPSLPPRANSFHCTARKDLAAVANETGSSVDRTPKKPEATPTKTGKKVGPATAWPWMLDEGDRAMAGARACPNDQRPLVKDLIREHRSAIDEIKMGLLDNSLYEPEKHDDLWILRFWLSHQRRKPALEAAKKTLQFRKDLRLDQWDIREYAPSDCNEGTMVHEYLQFWDRDAVVFSLPDRHSPEGPKFFIKLAGRDQHKLTKELTEDHWFAFFGQCAEWCFQWADYRTRLSGRLTNCVGFVDAQGMSLKSFHAECTLRDGRALGVLHDCYPQTIEAIKIRNPPGGFRILWRMVRAVLPKSVVAMLDSCVFDTAAEINKEEHRSSNQFSKTETLLPSAA